MQFHDAEQSSGVEPPVPFSAPASAQNRKRNLRSTSAVPGGRSLETFGKSMSDLLQAIFTGWGWKIGKPVEVVVTNQFGNAIVRNEEGSYFRIMPEEWQCELVATSATELEEKRKSEEFIRDWEMTALVCRAKAAHGPLAEGQVYYLVIPGLLGGKYSEENIRKISLQEVLSYCGDMAHQMENVPDGTEVKILLKE